MSEDLNEAIAAAADEAEREVKGEEAPAEETSASEPAKEEVKSEGEAEEKTTEAEPEPEPEKAATEETPEENDFNLSAEELKAINDNPLLVKAYKSLQGAATKKFQSAAEKAKSAEEAVNMIEYIRQNPDASLEEMARARGYIIAKKDAGEAAKEEATASAGDAVNSIMEKYSKDLGPESTKLLLPFMKEVAEAVVQQTVSPIQQTTADLQRTAKERGIAAAVHEFGASIKESGEDWNDGIIEQMANMMDAVVPGERTSMQDYLGTLYNAVTAKNARESQVRAQLSRLKKAKEEAEPTRAVRPAPKTDESITADMSERDAIAMATRLAEAEAKAM